MGFRQLAAGEKGLVCELGLILEPDSVPCLVVSHCMLQDHELQHLLHFGGGKLALGDEGGNAGGQGMHILVRELADIRKEFIPEVPEVFLTLDSGPNGI